MMLDEIKAAKKYALNGGPFGSKLVTNDYIPEGVPVIRGTNLSKDTYFSFEDLVFVSEEKADELKPNNAHPGDIIFTQRGTLGQVGIIPKICKYKRFVISQSQMKLTVDEIKTDSYFIYYYFRNPNTIQRIKNLAFSSGVPHINLQVLREFEIELPPLPTQRKIAAILSAYDDLIENNTRRIKILEEMASALYREWFVNFRFPGHEKVRMEESELGPKPEGWEVVKVDSILKRLKAGNKYTATNVANVGKIPVVDQSRDEFLGFHNNDPDFMASPKNPIIIFGDHTCKMQMMVEPFSIGPNVVPFIPIADIPTQYIYFLVRNLVETKEYKRHWSELKNKKIVFDPNTDSRKFSAFTIPILEQINLLTKKNQILLHTRDLLLPSLISGEIDINVLENGVDMFKS